MPPRILIVDDETDLVRLVRYNLEKELFEVFVAYDGKGALSQIRAHSPDLLILDLMLPDMSGFQICQQIKQEVSTQNIPVIMLTARSSETDRVTGFESGADDYVVKPFSPKELVLRVKALLNRTLSQGAAESSTRLQLENIVVYPKAHRVETLSGEAISLSCLEFKLLLSLIRQPNTVKTREQLIAEVWEQEGENISDRTVDTHIKRLRRKLGPSRNIIETIRGIGYRALPLNPSGLPEAVSNRRQE